MSTGLPKWTPEIWRAAVSLRLRLKNEETINALMVLLTDESSVFSHVKPVLASGATQKAIDATTGAEDTTIPVGYTWTMISYWWAFNQPLKGMEYIDAQPFTSLHEGSFTSHYEHDIMPDHFVLDPTGVSAHTHGYTLKNLGDDDMEGYFNAGFIVTEVGTDRFNFKVVVCKYCGAEREVNRRATKVRCEECGLITFYMPQLFGMKEKPILDVEEP